MYIITSQQIILKSGYIDDVCMGDEKSVPVTRDSLLIVFTKTQFVTLFNGQCQRKKE